MNEPWGISGPVFAGLYAGSVVAPMLVGALLVGLRKRHSPGSVLGRLPSIYHFAYLAGGPDRVTDTVVASMMEREQLRVSSSGKLYTTPQQPVGPLEAEVAQRFGKLPSTAYTLYEPMRGSAAMLALAAELAEMKLVFPDRARRRVWHTVLGVYAAVVVLGVIRAINGGRLGYPIGYLVGLIVLALAGIACSVWFARPRAEDQNTNAGWDAYSQNKGDRSLVHGAAGVVAKRGLIRYPDYEVAKALTKEHALHTKIAAQRKRGRSSVGYASGGGFVGGYACSSGSSSCGGGGSSCSGGSSGGGGGCGGGGGG
ncbi:TIGR04222 domain-containing membrane protein [Amycolatopsis sp.]|jgi:uncharacterized protein (TIGR04222 family)|uniref:TIGR04222 domain-containing membrane protein n=1 Tax=Amycolatopsis sp. TaxID=37632 RepID=UPI002DFCDDC5|nr:TIGR04222 domain-containing membrane protein [Amycolatopsis sp.]